MSDRVKIAPSGSVFLRSFAAKIWMLVRGPSLAESMSQYLIDRIEATDNIEVLTQTEIVAPVRESGKTAGARTLAQ